MIASMDQVIKIIETWAPRKLAEDWDNVGWMIGNTRKTVNKVMIALEITGDVVDEAIEKSVDLIITHHPLIFKGLKSISDRDAQGKWIMKLIRHNISVYSAHTNLDSAYGGINDYLCSLFGLERTMGLSENAPFEPTSSKEDQGHGMQSSDEPQGIGRIAWLPLPMGITPFLENVKTILGIDKIRFSGSDEAIVSKVALCSGAGADLIREAANKGCDLYLTGDIKYHEYRLAHELGISIVDMSHFASENIYMTYLAERLQMACDEKDYEIRIVSSEVLTQPYSEL